MPTPDYDIKSDLKIRQFPDYETWVHYYSNDQEEDITEDLVIVPPTVLQPTIQEVGVLKGNGDGSIDGLESAEIGYRGIATEIIQGDTDLITGGAVYSAINNINSTLTGKQNSITATGVLYGNGNGVITTMDMSDYVVSNTLNNYILKTDLLENNNSRVKGSYLKSNFLIKTYTSTTNLQLSSDWDGWSILINNSSTVTITIPTTLTTLGFEVEILRYGNGTVNIKAAQGVILNGDTAGSAGITKAISTRHKSVILKYYGSDYGWNLQGDFA